MFESIWSAHGRMRCEDGKFVKVGKSTIKNGMQYPERVVYFDEEENRYWVKLNKVWMEVKKNPFHDMYNLA